jgi:putative nucleotidyltransferase with HDIG domain
VEQDIKDKIRLKIKDMPTLPMIATRILEVTGDPESSVRDLQEIIKMDQVVSARIMKAVNSAFFGFPRRIDTLSQAIVILGFNNVRSLALSVSISGAFAKEQSGSGFPHGKLWQHAVGVAFMAQALARSLGWRKTEHFFMAGLLHDIGFIPMDQAFPGDLQAAFALSRKEEMPLYLAEKEKLGFTHADVGHYIAEAWLLPPTIAEPIALHHAPPERLDNPEVTYAVHAADILCKLRNFGGYGDNQFVDAAGIDEQARGLFKIKDSIPKDVEEFLDENMGLASDFYSIFK